MIVRRASRLLALAALSASLGCVTGVVDLIPPAPDSTVPPDAGSVDASRVDTDAAAPRCVAPGPPIRLGSTCAGTIAAQVGTNALCVCDQLRLTFSLRTDSFDSRHVAMAQFAGASVGTNDYVEAVGSSIFIGGSLTAAGSGGIKLSFRFDGVTQNVWSGGPLVEGGGGHLSVGGDAYANGDVVGGIMVGGKLHVPFMAMVPPGSDGDRTIRGPVMVAPPCGCSAQQLAVNVPGELQQRYAQNDDLSLPPGTADDLANGRGPGTIDLGCGEYYVSALKTFQGASLQLNVHGRVGLFVAGAVEIGGSLKVNLDGPDSELDLVVGAGLSVGESVGSQAAPARVRIWLGGQTLQIGRGGPGGPGLGQSGAMIYAPAATLSWGDSLTFSGALFVGAMSGFGSASLHYDRALLEGGADCSM